MARDTSGSKNQPQYVNGGVSAQAADLTEVALYASLIGNRKIGPTTGTATGPGGMNTGRTTSSGADVWEGLEWHDTTDGNTYKYLSGSWVLVFGDTGWSTLTVSGTGWSSAGDGTYDTGKIRTKNGRILIRGIFSKTSWSAFDTITTLAAGSRPTGAVTLPCRIGAGTPGTARILSNGSLQVEEAGSGFIVIDAGFELS